MVLKWNLWFLKWNFHFKTGFWVFFNPSGPLCDTLTSNTCNFRLTGNFHKRPDLIERGWSKLYISTLISLIFPTCEYTKWWFYLWWSQLWSSWIKHTRWLKDPNFDLCVYWIPTLILCIKELQNLVLYLHRNLNFDSAEISVFSSDFVNKYTPWV